SNLSKDIHHLVEVAAAQGLEDADLLQVTKTTAARIAKFAADTGGVTVV
ncbi:MAG: hypothetical protein JWQ97_210, partial [Phenylobacterium sp.]|nr:hypothetical protein [Phenylobacterium sp.]